MAVRMSRPLQIGLHVNALLPPLFHAPADLYSVDGIGLVFGKPRFTHTTQTTLLTQRSCGRLSL